MSTTSCRAEQNGSDDECCSACSGVLDAYRDEIRKLSDAVELHARADGMQGALEGKYLEQVNKCRVMRVQLEQARRTVRDLQDQLHRLMSTAALSSTTTTTAGKAAVKKNNAAAAPADRAVPHGTQHKCSPPINRGRREGGTNHSTTHTGNNSSSISDASASAACTGSESVSVLRERLGRVYKQLHERDRTVEEMRRQCHTLIALVSQEVGIDKEAVMQMLSHAPHVGLTDTASSAADAAADTQSMSRKEEGEERSRRRNRRPGNGAALPVGPSAFLLGGPGWRGRAAQIVLLQSRVKDLERALHTCGCRRGETEEEDPDGDTSNDNDDDEREERAGHVEHADVEGSESGEHAEGNDRSNSARTGRAAGNDHAEHQQEQQTPFEGEVGSGGAAKARRRVRVHGAASTTTTTTTHRMHVDDSARETVDRVANRRWCTMREQEAALMRQAEELREAGQRYAGVQGRLQTVQRELRELKSYVHVILDKSETDDKLLELYRSQLDGAKQAEEDSDEDAAVGAARCARESTPRRSPAAAAAQSSCDAHVAATSGLTGAGDRQECIRLRNEVAMLEDRLLRLAAPHTAGTRTTKQANNSSDSSSHTRANADGKGPLWAESCDAMDDAHAEERALMQWVRDAVDAVRASRAADAGDASSTRLMVQVGAFLDAVQRHTRTVEMQMERLESQTTTRVLERCVNILASVERRLGGESAALTLAAGGGGANASSLAESASASLCDWLNGQAHEAEEHSHDKGPRLAVIILQENRALKQRVKTLTQMAQYEAHAHQARFDHLLQQYRSAVPA